MITQVCEDNNSAQLYISFQCAFYKTCMCDMNQYQYLNVKCVQDHQNQVTSLFQFQGYRTSFHSNIGPIIPSSSGHLDMYGLEEVYHDYKSETWSNLMDDVL